MSEPWPTLRERANACRVHIAHANSVKRHNNRCAMFEYAISNRWNDEEIKRWKLAPKIVNFNCRPSQEAIMNFNQPCACVKICFEDWQMRLHTHFCFDCWFAACLAQRDTNCTLDWGFSPFNAMLTWKRADRNVLECREPTLTLLLAQSTHRPIWSLKNHNSINRKKLGKRADGIEITSCYVHQQVNIIVACFSHSSSQIWVF